MTPRISENVPTWFADWSLVGMMPLGMMPPRDPNDDDDDAEDEDGDVEPDDDPAVVREPDE
jgi:hypothetical protein